MDGSYHRNVQPIKVLRIRVRGTLSHGWGIYHLLHPSGAITEEGPRGRTRGSGGVKQNSVLWTRQDCCSQEHAAAADACTRPVEEQTC